MSRFLDFELVSFGFLVKLVGVSDVGGVTAGSTVSKPRVFFLKDVVAISFELMGWNPAAVGHDSNVIFPLLKSVVFMASSSAYGQFS